MKKALLLALALISFFGCKTINPKEIIKIYEPKEILFSQNDTFKILTVGKCTTFIERNFYTKEIKATLKSGNDTTFVNLQEKKTEKAEKKGWFLSNIKAIIFVVCFFAILNFLGYFFKLAINKKNV